MNVKSNEFSAIVKAIGYYKRLVTEDRMEELPRDAEKVFWDADIALAEMRKRRDADSKRTAENMKRHREADPFYGNEKRRAKVTAGLVRKPGRPRKTEKTEDPQ